MSCAEVEVEVLHVEESRPESDYPLLCTCAAPEQKKVFTTGHFKEETSCLYIFILIDVFFYRVIYFYYRLFTFSQ